MDSPALCALCSKKTAAGVNLVEKILVHLNDRGRGRMGAKQGNRCKTFGK